MKQGIEDVYMAKVQVGEYEAALADYSAAIEVDPSSCYALYNRGITHDRLGSYAAAVKDFSAALAIDPNNADFYHNRGFSLRKLVPPPHLRPCSLTL